MQLRSAEKTVLWGKEERRKTEKKIKRSIEKERKKSRREKKEERGREKGRKRGRAQEANEDREIEQKQISSFLSVFSMLSNVREACLLNYWYCMELSESLLIICIGKVTQTYKVVSTFPVLSVCKFVQF